MQNNSGPVLFIIPGACSLGSMITLELLNIPYQVCITDEKIRASAEFRKVNPIGKVAALKDRDICVGENIAIIQYLLDAYGDENTGRAKPSTQISGHIGLPINEENIFFPPKQDLQHRARMYQWLSYCSSTLHPAFSQVNYAHKYAPEYTEEFKKIAYQRLLLVLDYINESLKNGYLLFKDKMSIVDGQAYGLLRWLSYTPNGEQILLERNNIKQFLQNMEHVRQVNNALAVEKQQISSLQDSQFAGYFVIAV
jgi:glutathione S-transferase